MRQINYKSDFDFVLKLKECKGENQEAAEVPFPDCDWEAVFYTSSKANSYTASCKGGEYVNCFKDEGGIHLVFNDHRMGVGTLKWEPHFELPNDIYPNSIQDLFSKQHLGIELVNGPGDCPTTAEVAVLLPYIKGEPFTYEDFTPEQIADLKRPATEAAERADKAVRAAEKATQEAVASNKQLAGNVAEAAGAETERVEAETARVTAETQRQSAEDTRKANEVERVKAEGLRDSNEATRESQEAERQSAETGRINAEKARVSAEASRVAAETKRASDFTEAEAQRQSTFESAEAERAQAEATRVSNESIRIGNEQSRVNAEHTRASQETARQDAESARQSNEQSRVTAEGARVEAETARAAEFATWETELDGKQNKLSTTTDLHITDDSIIGLTEKGSRKMFDEMFLKMAGEHGAVDYSHFENDVHKPYCLNELWLTYEEVKRSMMYPLRVVSNYMGEYYANVNIRTNICYPHISFTQINCQNFANLCTAEVLRFPPRFQPTNSSGMFVNCGNLKKVFGPIYPIQPATQQFYGSSIPKLEYIEMILRADVDLSRASRLTIECIEYLITNAVNTKTITIKVHPNVYEKLTDTNNTEWYAQLTAAAAKNISFATI